MSVYKKEPEGPWPEQEKLGDRLRSLRARLAGSLASLATRFRNAYVV